MEDAEKLICVSPRHSVVQTAECAPLPTIESFKVSYSCPSEILRT